MSFLSSDTPAWVDEDEEEPKVTVAGTGSTSRFRKYATKEEIAESNTEVKVVSFKGVRAHNKRHTKPVSISKSQFEERLREQFRTLSRVSSEWAEIKENEEEVDKDKGIIILFFILSFFLNYFFVDEIFCLYNYSNINLVSWTNFFGLF